MPDTLPDSPRRAVPPFDSSVSPKGNIPWPNRLRLRTLGTLLRPEPGLSFMQPSATPSLRISRRPRLAYGPDAEPAYQAVLFRLRDSLLSPLLKPANTAICLFANVTCTSGDLEWPRLLVSSAFHHIWLPHRTSRTPCNFRK